MNIQNKSAIITGASSGLGAAAAKALIKKGAQVYGLARNIEALSKLKNELGNSFIPVKMDITNQKAINNWINSVFIEESKPTILINNAGIGSFGKIDELSSEQWLGMINTNLNGMFYLTSKVASLMKHQDKSAHIINIGSILGTTGRAESTAYCTTKFGIRGFSEALYKELKAFNIKVTCVNPGSIETNFFESSGVESHQNMLHPNDLANTIVYLLETPDNMLINELNVRPLNPKKPED